MSGVSAVPGGGVLGQLIAGSGPSAAQARIAGLAVGLNQSPQARIADLSISVVASLPSARIADLTITVVTAPIVVFILTPGATGTLSVTADASATTDPGGSSLGLYSYNWGDGTTPVATTAPIQTHTYATAGTYTVALTVTNAGGGSATSSQSVVISPAAMRRIFAYMQGGVDLPLLFMGMVQGGVIVPIKFDGIMSGGSPVDPNATI
jgi:PKD domain